MVLSLLLDFAWTSLLLFLGYQLRRKVKLFQKLFIPAPLIAGILGMLLSENVLGLFSPICIRFSEYLSQAALPVLACVFCGQLFLIKMDRNAYKKSFLTYILTAVVILYQIVLGILLVRLLMPGANDGYGMLPFTSFLGGPGVCAVLAGVIGEQVNFSVDTANAIGTTYATISVLTGVTFGMVAINIAHRKGILAQSGSIDALSEEELSGYVLPEHRRSAGMDVTNGNSLNTMTLQFSIAGILLLVGYGIMKLLHMLPGLSSVGITIGVFAGIPVGFVFKKLGWEDIVDKRSLGHFSSIALEYLITFTIATTNLTVFATHGTLILVTTLVMLVCNLLFIFGLGKLWFKEHWFENMIGVYGLGNGVMATGLLLIRTADPEDQAGVLTNFSSAVSLMMITTQLVYLFFIPLWVTNHGSAVLLGSTAALAVALLLGFVVSGKSGS